MFNKWLLSVLLLFKRAQQKINSLGCSGYLFLFCFYNSIFHSYLSCSLLLALAVICSYCLIFTLPSPHHHNPLLSLLASTEMPILGSLLSLSSDMGSGFVPLGAIKARPERVRDFTIFTQCQYQWPGRGKSITGLLFKVLFAKAHWLVTAMWYIYHKNAIT